MKTLKLICFVCAFLLINQFIPAQESVLKLKGMHLEKKAVIGETGDTVYQNEWVKDSIPENPDSNTKVYPDLKNERGNPAMKEQKEKKIYTLEDFSSRYFFSPSGYGLKKHEGYYQCSEVFLQSLYYGLTDNVSLGGGSLLLYPAYFSARTSFEFTGDLHFGVGYLLLNDPSGGGKLVNVVYATMTIGSRARNISINYGGNLDDVSKLPIYTVNGFYKLNNYLGLVTENWIFSINRDNLTSFNLYTAGIRILAWNVPIDLGIMAIDHSNQIIWPIPVGSFSIPF